MKLSVLIPMYNVEDYIANCLDSIINQDISSNEYEIIIIDDGSSDNSKVIAEDYAKKHINISLHSQTNIGLYATRNKLLELAKGRYVYNLDSDDYIAHNCLGTVVEMAIEKDVDILGFDFKRTEKLDLFVSQNELKNFDYKIESGNNFLSRNHTHFNTVWWYLLKRDFMLANAIKFDENNPLGDGPFTLNAIHFAEKMLYLPLDIHRYVQHSNSIMNNQSKAHFKKMINHYIEISSRYNLLAQEISKKNNSNVLEGVILKVLHWRDVNIKVLFSRLAISNTSIREINRTINKLKVIDAYPIKYFIGKRFNSLTQRLIVFVYNNRIFYFIAVLLLRVYYKLNSSNGQNHWTSGGS